jgi:hypothetical protein
MAASRWRRIAAIGLATILAWQALLGLAALFAQTWASRSAGWSERFAGDTDARLQRGLGSDLAIVRALRTTARRDEWVLTAFPIATAGTPAGLERAARLTKLRHATFPAPFLVPAGADAIGAAEAAVTAGKSALLLTIAGDAEPMGRVAWGRMTGGEGFAVWRLERP